MVGRHLALAVGLFAGGIILLAYGFMRGEVAAGIALFIPFIYGSGAFASLGVLLVFLGILALFVPFFTAGAQAAALDEEGEVEESGQPGPVQKTPEKGGAAPSMPPSIRPKIRGGAVIMIGPIPVVAGSDPSMTRRLMIMALVLMAAAMILMVFLALW